MHESANRELHPSAPRSMCDSVHAMLAATFMPARLFLSWADQPIIMPGFRVRITGGHVIVQYVQPHDGALRMRRACARLMIEQYRLTLLANGWHIDVVDDSRKMPYLRCWLASSFMSS